MANKDRVVEFLQRRGDSGATNEEIVSHTGIRPHQQVFMITRDLMQAGDLKGVQAGKEWRFWLKKQHGLKPSSAPRQVALASKPNFPTPLEFEKSASVAMSNVFGVRLAPGRAEGVPKLFDCFSEDGPIVGDIKFYTLVAGERLPPAKFSTIAEHVWLLEKATAQRKFLAFGNDRRVPEQWLKRFGHLATTVEFYFIDSEGMAMRLDLPKDPSDAESPDPAS